MTHEEQEVYNKIARMKRENELLTVIFEEIDDLVKRGYDGQFIGEDVSGVFYAVNEYKKWKNSTKRDSKNCSVWYINNKIVPTVQIQLGFLFLYVIITIYIFEG